MDSSAGKNGLNFFVPIFFNAKGMGKRRQWNIITFPWHISYSLYTSSEEDRQANSRLASTSVMCPGNQHLPWPLPDLALTPVGLFVLNPDLCKLSHHKPNSKHFASLLMPADKQWLQQSWAAYLILQIGFTVSKEIPYTYLARNR